MIWPMNVVVRIVYYMEMLGQANYVVWLHFSLSPQRKPFEDCTLLLPTVGIELMQPAQQASALSIASRQQPD